MSITTVFDPPLAGDSQSVFNTKAFDTFSKLNTWAGEANAVQVAINVLASAAAASQTAAATSETNASAFASAAAASAIASANSAGAAMWVSGTYSAGAAARSPSNLRVYINKTTGIRTTDPAGDPTNWVDAVFGERIRITTNTNAVVGKLYELDSRGGSFNVTLPASYSDKDRIGFVDVGCALSTYPVTVVRNGNNIRLTGEDLVLDLSCDSLSLVAQTSLGWIEE
jgi:hypothetical protein